jgi:alanine-glyoxylate transaminase/serine-glyoxylate transaminase/serine-pyruvate transaminase
MPSREGAEGERDREAARAFWDWKPMIASNARLLPYTPATNMLYALDTAIDMLLARGAGQRLRAARPQRGGDAGARCGMGLEIQCADPGTIPRR